MHEIFFGVMAVFFGGGEIWQNLQFVPEVVSPLRKIVQHPQKLCANFFITTLLDISSLVTSSNIIVVTSKETISHNVLTS